MKARTSKKEKNDFQDFNLVNNFEMPKVNGILVTDLNNIIGLGNVTKHRYAYGDICTNGMN